MRIGVISDTHDHQRNVFRAIDIFNERGVQCVFHAGDIVSPATAQAFAQLHAARFIAVFGNCDTAHQSLCAAIETFGGEVYPSCYEGAVDGRTIHMVHRDYTVDEIARSQKYDLVLYGHTHRHDVRQVGKTLIVNPGEASGRITGSPQVVILDLADMTVSTELLG
jgi:putative phosphoesterase